MTSFINQIGDDAVDSTKKGWLVSILELGAWAGTLFTGYLADKLSRKFTILLAVVVFVRYVTMDSTRIKYSLVSWLNSVSV